MLLCKNIKFSISMKRFFLILFSVFLLQSCDDGDIIVTSFDFSETDLKYCGGPGDYVFYKINVATKESLSLRLSTSDSIFKLLQDKEYVLNGVSDYVNYRSYDATVGNSYFCTSVPPTSPKVLIDYFGGSGKVQIGISIITEDGVVTKKRVKITLKDISMVSGDEKIIQETLEMGAIEIPVE